MELRYMSQYHLSVPGYDALTCREWACKGIVADDGAQ